MERRVLNEKERRDATATEFSLDPATVNQGFSARLD